VLIGYGDYERRVFVSVDLLQMRQDYPADHLVLGDFCADKIVNVFSADVARDVELQQSEVVLHTLFDLLHLL
jgi:hypothetical protein